jgi:hypothetical protein
MRIGKSLIVIVAFGGFAGANLFAANIGVDGAKIDQITGLKGKLNEKEGAYKVTFPRNDVPVSVDGWKMPPFMGLGTWAAFTKGVHAEAMVMGDTVLFEDEVNPAMSVALENGLSVTALHNHFFFDHPKVFFMHIAGEGTTEQLAGGVRKVYDKVKEIRGANPQPKDSFGASPLPEKSSITAEPLNAIFGMTGEMNNGMVKFTIGRPAKMRGVNIVAIHSHMTYENPRMLFFHYWGRGPAKELAETIKTALLVNGLLTVSSPVPRQ